MILSLAKEELASRLNARSFWLLLALTQGLLAWLMLAQLEVYQQISPHLIAAGSALGLNDLVAGPTFNSLALLLLIATPLLTAGAIVQERATGRLQLVYASPTTTRQLVFGKLLGNWLASACVALSGAMTIACLALAGQLDWGRWLAALLGVLLISAFASSATLLFSTISTRFAGALSASYGLLFLLWMLDSLLSADNAGYWYALLPHATHLLGGLARLSDLLYWLIPAATFASLSWIQLSHERGHLRRFRWPLTVLAVLLVPVSGQLAQGLYLQFDMSSVARNTLPAATQQALDALPGKLTVSMNAPPSGIVPSQANRLLERLDPTRERIELTLIDPATQSELVRRIGLLNPGEALLESGGRSEFVERPTLAAVTAAMIRLARRGEAWIVAFSGPGAASLTDTSPLGLSRLAELLDAQGYRSVELDPQVTGTLPDNAALIIIAGPASDYPPRLVNAINSHLSDGGKLLWLNEYGHPVALADKLGITTLAGRVIDPTQDTGTKKNTQLVMTHTFPDDLLPRKPTQPVVFDGVAPLLTGALHDWQVVGSLLSSIHSWNETGQPDGNAIRQPLLGEMAGPHLLLTALQKDQSRIVITGDRDFVNNTRIGQSGNRALILGLVHWLTGNTLLPTATVAQDLAIDWPQWLSSMIAITLTLILPLVYLFTGVLIHHRRHRH